MEGIRPSMGCRAKKEEKESMYTTTTGNFMFLRCSQNYKRIYSKLLEATVTSWEAKILSKTRTKGRGDTNIFRYLKFEGVTDIYLSRQKAKKRR